MDLVVGKMGSSFSSLENGCTLGSLIATKIHFGLHFAQQNLNRGPSIYKVGNRNLRVTKLGLWHYLGIPHFEKGLFLSKNQKLQNVAPKFDVILVIIDFKIKVSKTFI